MAFDSKRRVVFGNCKGLVGNYDSGGTSGTQQTNMRRLLSAFWCGVDTGNNSIVMNINSATDNEDNDGTGGSVIWQSSADANYNTIFRGY